MALGGTKIPYGIARDARTLGGFIRADRRARKLTQSTLAGLTGVGLRFISELERGKSTVELGRVLRVLERMGLEVWVIPRSAPWPTQRPTQQPQALPPQHLDEAPEP